MISETSFFTEIFEDFVGSDNQFQENEKWKSNSIIKLMQVSNGVENKKIIEEGLKIILNLCRFKDCGCLLDSYERESYSTNALLKPDRELFETILKAEFM
ncbi:hypothetical protein LCGC14_0719890 [marine sediment metagenome]|uniref:Uncharacterized protein n=1 Tax=marine sediment metagenome TaxID=412755 RepID=A0A0F9SY54_9ZZZZ